MPHKPHHRGKHPEDTRLFSAAWIPILREAVADLSFLLSRGYAERAAQKVVGDHYQLDVRQRRAVLGASCAADALARRRATCVASDALAGSIIRIDGYNLLIAVECALSRGLLLRGRDGCLRDLASVHGSYRRVEETLPAVRQIARTLESLGVTHAYWCFDAPVSNSGRLKTLLGTEAARQGWPWTIALAPNPDKSLAQSDDIVVTADGWILDRAARWTNLAPVVVEGITPSPEVIDLAPPR